MTWHLIALVGVVVSLIGNLAGILLWRRVRRHDRRWGR